MFLLNGQNFLASDSLFLYAAERSAHKTIPIGGLVAPHCDESKRSAIRQHEQRCDEKSISLGGPNKFKTSGCAHGAVIF